MAWQERLRDDIDMKLSESTYCLGPKLYFDGKTEQFTYHTGANMLLTRPYRAPYVAPEKV